MNDVTYARSPALPGVELVTFVIRGAPSPVLVDHRYLFGEREPGVVVAQEPGDVVTIERQRAHDKDEARARAVLIEPALVATRLGGNGARARLPRGRLGAVAAPAFAALFDAVAARAPASEQQARLDAFLDAAGATPATVPARGPSVPVSRARAFLDERFADPVHLDDLERVAGLSRFYLVRRFRSEIGLPPHAYQLALRIDRARSLIGDGVALHDVASRCGFTDQSHLTRHFRRAVGVTPGAYARALGVGRAVTT